MFGFGAGNGSCPIFGLTPSRISFSRNEVLKVSAESHSLYDLPPELYLTRYIFVALAASLFNSKRASLRSKANEPQFMDVQQTWSGALPPRPSVPVCNSCDKWWSGKSQPKARQ